MSVLVKLSSTLRDHVPAYTPETGLNADLAACGSPCTAETLALHLGLPLEEIRIVMINGRQEELSCPLRDGDRVAYFPAVGGG